MDKIIPLKIYGFPLIGIAYVLFKLLRRHINYLSRPVLSNQNDKTIKVKIGFLLFGILYSLSYFVGLGLLFYKPDWFKPPTWLVISSIVLVVPSQQL